MTSPTPPAPPPAADGASNSTRYIIIAIVVLALLAIGYCFNRVAHVASSVVGAAQGMQSRMDTTHHVAPGSAVYLGDTKVADIMKVVVVHADTSPRTAPYKNAFDSVMHEALRHGMVLYYSATPTPDDAGKVIDNTLVGHITGTYDSDSAVKITLAPRAGAPVTDIPPGQLNIPGRARPIPIY
jgi:hypothetical protein